MGRISRDLLAQQPEMDRTRKQVSPICECVPIYVGALTCKGDDEVRFCKTGGAQTHMEEEKWNLMACKEKFTQ